MTTTWLIKKAILKAYQLALSRPATSKEITEGMKFIRRQESSYATADARDRSMTDFCQVILSLNEFVYVE